MPVHTFSHAWRWLKSRYFAPIWPPFVFYLVLYNLVWWTGVSVPAATGVFQALHLVHLLLLVIWAWSARRDRRFVAVAALFVGAFALLTWVGAYLEYPSDPWEHWRRILGWQGWSDFSRNDTRFKFSYFWGYTWLSGVPVAWHRLATDAYSSFWQLLAVWQFYRLLRALELPRAAGAIGALTFLLYFGTAQFGFRYYALGTFPISWIAMLGGLIVIIETETRGARSGWALIPILYLIAFNHAAQETMNLAVTGGALLALRAWSSLTPPERRRVLRAVGGVVIAAFVVGTLVIAFRGWLPPRIQSRISGFVWAPWGGISLFNSQMRISSTLGLPGALSIIAAVYAVFRGRYRALAVVALAPVAFLTLPPTALLIPLGGMRASLTLYRMLYAFPVTVFGAILLFDAINHAIAPRGDAFGRHFFADARRRRSAAVALSALLIATTSFVYARPWYGRGYFQFYRASAEHSLVPQDQTAAWFSQNRDVRLMRGACRLITDDVTYFNLATHLALPLSTVRGVRNFELREVLEPTRNPDRPDLAIRYQGACGALVIAPDPATQTFSTWLASPMASITGHWVADAADRRPFQPLNPRRAINQLAAQGWKITPVPPDYLYLEPYGPPHPNPAPSATPKP